MTVNELIIKCGLTVFSHINDREVTSVYCCDLLSNALVKLKEGAAWLTVMNNVNVAAVAYNNKASCVVLVEGVAPDPMLLKKAKEYDVTILGSDHDVYNIIRLIGELEQ